MYLFIDGHLGYFYFLAILNNAAVNTLDSFLYKHMLSFLLGVWQE